jgi:ubiquinone/menaquinone biosynthesis C-methylase UbiE
MRDYYDARLAEYDEVYRKPERQGDLKIVREEVRRRVQGRKTLELACGTGYWTAVASASAKRIIATDVSEGAITVARQRHYACPVEFSVKDALRLEAAPVVDMTIAMFWWSHVPKQELEKFLADVRATMRREGALLFLDNRFVPGSSTAISRTDPHDNTYQMRTLRDGASHEVLKNFPTRSEVEQALASVGGVVEVVQTQYYWLGQVQLMP